MSTLLALDTSTSLCSVALWHKKELTEQYVSIERGHTQHILPLIDQLLSDSGIFLNTIDALAVTAGPGSFAGLRIGMGVTQGLAFSNNLPVISLSTLQVLAQDLIDTNRSTEKWILPVLDARMGELFWGLYRQNNNLENNHNPDFDRPLVSPMVADQVSSCEHVSENLLQLLDDIENRGILAKGMLYATGNGVQLLDRLNIGIIKAAPEGKVMASNIIPLALENLALGKVITAENLEPYYIRDTIHWKKRKRLR